MIEFDMHVWSFILIGCLIWPFVGFIDMILERRKKS